MKCKKRLHNDAFEPQQQEVLVYRCEPLPFDADTVGAQLIGPEVQNSLHQTNELYSLIDKSEVPAQELVNHCKQTLRFEETEEGNSVVLDASKSGGAATISNTLYDDKLLSNSTGQRQSRSVAQEPATRVSEESASDQVEYEFVGTKAIELEADCLLVGTSNLDDIRYEFADTKAIDKIEYKRVGTNSLDEVAYEFVGTKALDDVGYEFVGIQAMEALVVQEPPDDHTLKLSWSGRHDTPEVAAVEHWKTLDATTNDLPKLVIAMEQLEAAVPAAIEDGSSEIYSQDGVAVHEGIPEHEYADQKWNLQFAKLRHFRAQHGHVLVPWTSEAALYQWIQKQRKQFDTGTLQPKRVETLNLLDQHWLQPVLPPEMEEDLLDGMPDKLPTDKRWNHRFRQLESHKAEHGHVRVSQRQDLALYHWLLRQRNSRHGSYNGGLALSHERLEALNRLDSNWHHVDRTEIPDLLAETTDESDTVDLLQGVPNESAGDKKWNAKFRELEQFRNVHGHVGVSQCQNRSLYQWLNRQRNCCFGKYNGSAALTSERMAALHRLDSNWSTKPGRWDYSNL